MHITMFRVFQTMAMFFLMVPIGNAQDAVDVLDGNWYSTQWKYGYVLKMGLALPPARTVPTSKWVKTLFN